MKQYKHGYSIDPIDEEILKLLSRNAKTPFTEIAKQLSLSNGTIHQRVKKMEKQGVIKGNAVILDYTKLGYGLTSYLGVMMSDSSKINKVIKEIEKIPEIVLAHFTTGKFSIFCQMRSKNTEHAMQVIQKIQLVEGVLTIESMISFKEIINRKNELMANLEKV